MGLSNEINQIEREKRDAASYEKKLQSLMKEREALMKELETAKNSAASDGERSLAQEEPSLEASEENIEELEAETSRLREEVSFSQDANVQSDIANGDGDTIMLNDTAMDGDTVILSNSPDIRGVECQPAIPDEFSLLDHTAPGVDSSIQAQLPDYNQEAELRRLESELEAARKEKRNLFDACRAHITSFDGTAVGNSLRQSSPPPDFFDQIVPTLARASDATSSLESVKQELSTLGFLGSSPSEIISEMRSQFRTARIELERAVPGETANASMYDGNATLGALVKRVELLVKDLGDERTRHDGTLGRERALKREFDALLVRCEAASKKVQDLEHASSVSASDMLHTRMRMQEMEQEGKEQAIGLERLNAALEKYCEEVKSLEVLVTGLEEEKAASKEQHSQQVSKLESKVADEENTRHAAESTVARRDAHIRELEQTIEHNRIRTRDMMATVESLTKERQLAISTINSLEKKTTNQLQRHEQEIESLAKERQFAIESLEQKTAGQRQHYEQEIGAMNVRISELNTALEGVRAEAETLSRNNAALEEQLQLEAEARDNLMDKWFSDQQRSYALMKETVNAESRKAKVRSANYELLKSREPQSDSSVTGSEPITPVSMRHVDVEVGRGKHRRRLDSGVGIVTDDLLERMDHDEPLINSDGVDILPSDPAHL